MILSWVEEGTQESPGKGAGIMVSESKLNIPGTSYTVCTSGSLVCCPGVGGADVGLWSGTSGEGWAGRSWLVAGAGAQVPDCLLVVRRHVRVTTHQDDGTWPL